MGQRWRAVAVLAAALFGVNVVARLVIRFAFPDDDTASGRVSLAMFLVIGLILAGTAFRWGADRPLGRWAGDLAAAVAVALALTVVDFGRGKGVSVTGASASSPAACFAKTSAVSCPPRSSTRPSSRACAPVQTRPLAAARACSSPRSGSISLRPRRACWSAT